MSSSTFSTSVQFASMEHGTMHHHHHDMDIQQQWGKIEYKQDGYPEKLTSEALLYFSRHVCKSLLTALKSTWHLSATILHLSFSRYMTR